MQQQKLRFGWIGFHSEGYEALETLLADGVEFEIVVTLKPEQMAKKSSGISLHELCELYNTPIYETTNINDDNSYQILKNLALDIVFVIGWSQILSPRILNTASIGMIGAHASLLPHNRGSAPVNWAIIKGEKQTGNTLMWLSEGVDEGDIINQSDFPITIYDTCATLYEKVARSNKEMIIKLIPKLMLGERPKLVQQKMDNEILPRRRPKDGIIDWHKSSLEVYNFVRALTKPYPGAFSWLDGDLWCIWRCALLPVLLCHGLTPGQVIGSMYSPESSACGQVVSCGSGAVIILEAECEDGRQLSGSALSELEWIGKRWGYASCS